MYGNKKNNNNNQKKPTMSRSLVVAVGLTLYFQSNQFDFSTRLMYNCKDTNFNCFDGNARKCSILRL